MKLYYIDKPIQKELTSNKDVLFIISYNKDSKTLFFIVLKDTMVDMTKPQSRDCINNENMGYERLCSLIRGDVTVDFKASFTISSSLVFHNKELLGTDQLYQIISMSYLNKDYFGSGELAPFSAYGFYDFLPDRLTAPDMHVRYQLKEATNLLVETYNTKRNPFLPLGGYAPRLFVIFPTNEDDLDSDNTKVFVNPIIKGNILNKTGLKEETVKLRDFNKILKNDIADLEFVNVEKIDDYYQFTIRSYNSFKDLSNIPVYINLDGGYSNRKKIVTNEAGIGTFRVYPLGIEKGEKINIQIGFKVYTNIKNYELTV